MNLIYHPVSTSNAEAQHHFDEGLTNIYAFNHDLAFIEFQNAAALDPNLAMAYWGMALALGQNINTDVTPENEKKAYELIQKAFKLSSGISLVEQAYINALATRYTNDPNADLIPFRFSYRAAMKKLMDQFPEDLDAASLYAESILDLNPWKYWTRDGKPEAGTLEAVEVLESVLKRNPYHIGANHYLIHAYEDSPTPERALLAAYRLPTLSKAGHLLHMPNHIFLRLGYYENAIRTSQKAIAADKDYIKKFGIKGEYPLHYLTHNVNVLVRTYMLAENYPNAIKTALDLNDFLLPHYEKMPQLQHYKITPIEVYLYFSRWEELLKYNPPEASNAFVQAYWHFSRALAYINLNDLDSAQREIALMLKAKNQMNPKDEYANNSVNKVIELAMIVLDANIANAQNNKTLWIEKLNQAVIAQNQMDYDEPAAWYMPLSVQLGQALLEVKRYKEAEEAFRSAQKRFQRNGRILYGLSLSLEGQNRPWEQFWIKREMTGALNQSSKLIDFKKN
jgi:hypothetical protein